MNKILTVGMAAATLTAGVLATATAASARDWDDGYGGGGYYQGYDRGDGGDDAGAAIAGGIVGLALGSALTSHSYSEPYYGYSRPYYGSAYNGGYYQQGYRSCVSRRSVWDPYYGRYIVRKVRYAC